MNTQMLKIFFLISASFFNPSAQADSNIGGPQIRPCGQVYLSCDMTSSLGNSDKVSTILKTAIPGGNACNEVELKAQIHSIVNNTVDGPRKIQIGELTTGNGFYSFDKRSVKGKSIANLLKIYSYTKDEETTIKSLLLDFRNSDIKGLFTVNRANGTTSSHEIISASCKRL